MFEEKDSLPGAKLHSSLHDRNDFARTRENRANVRRAVVATFESMLEIWGILWNKMLEELLEVAPRGWVGVFHNREAAARVPNEYSEGPAFDAALSHRGCDPIGDFVGAFAMGGNGEGGGVNSHAGGMVAGGRQIAIEL